MSASLLEKLGLRESPLVNKKGFAIPFNVEIPWELVKSKLDAGKTSVCLRLNSPIGTNPSQETNFKWFSRAERKLFESIFPSNAFKYLNDGFLESILELCEWSEDDQQIFLEESTYVKEAGFAGGMSDKDIGSKALLVRVTTPDKPAALGYIYGKINQDGPDLTQERSPRLFFNSSYADIILGGKIIRITPFNVTNKQETANKLFPGESEFQCRYIDLSPGTRYVTGSSCYGDKKYLTFVDLTRQANIKINGMPLYVWVERPSGIPGSKVKKRADLPLAQGLRQIFT